MKADAGRAGAVGQLQRPYLPNFLPCLPTHPRVPAAIIYSVITVQALQGHCREEKIRACRRAPPPRRGLRPLLGRGGGAGCGWCLCCCAQGPLLA